MRLKNVHKLTFHRDVIQEISDKAVHAPVETHPVSEHVFQLINHRANGLNLPESFGVPANVEEIGYEFLLPALVKAEIPAQQPRVLIGGSQCSQPYEASLLNCSALSFGPMGKNFILTLNQAARRRGFFQNTGEAGLSPYHFGVDVDIEAPDFDIESFFDGLGNGLYPELQQAGDLVWQIGTGYFGCRGIDGSFSPALFQKKASLPNVKMIEIKLSQGVEPCKKMPVKQVTAGMTKIMGIRWDNQAKLQDEHSSFNSPLALVRFAHQLRTLSGGKPVGIKLGISHKHYFMAICKAMLKTGITLDFITVDGMEAGTAAASAGSLGYTGTPLNDAVLFVHNVLVGTNLRKQIKIIASGKVFTERDIVSKLVRGADLCATARGMMVSAGCDQQRECYKGMCQRGLATQDPELLKLFDIASNVERISNYHRLTIEELLELTSIAGVSRPDQLRPFHLQKRVGSFELKPLDEVYPFIRPGAFFWLFGLFIPASYRKPWKLACYDRPFVDG